jgi:hypothetical protein
MAKQRKTTGTGITAREVVTYDGEGMQAALVELSQWWNANRKKGGGDYGAVSLHIIERCRHILANSGGPYETDSPADFAEHSIIHETDSPADFAERIISRDKIAKAMIARGNADAAARFAFDVGLLAAQAIIKTVWERPALVGKKNLDSIQYGSAIANHQLHQEREKEWKRWNVRAAQIWKSKPNLSKRRAAAMVQRDLVLPDKIGTIADKLKKPPTTS